MANAPNMSSALREAAIAATGSHAHGNNATRPSTIVTPDSGPVNAEDVIIIDDDDSDDEDSDDDVVMSTSSQEQQKAHQVPSAGSANGTGNTTAAAAAVPTAAAVANTVASASSSDDKLTVNKSAEHDNDSHAMDTNMNADHPEAQQSAPNAPNATAANNNDDNNDNNTAAVAAAGAIKLSPPPSTPAPPKSRLDAHRETMDFWGLLARHKQAAQAVVDAVDAIETSAEKVEARVDAVSPPEEGMAAVEGSPLSSSSSTSSGRDGAARDGGGRVVVMKAKDRRMVWLMMKVVLGKDEEVLTAVETSLERTQHSMWKLSREVRAISKKLRNGDGADAEHDLYELLEGFVGALRAKRGADRAEWGDDGVELGEMLDRVKADMEWWDDGEDGDDEE